MGADWSERTPRAVALRILESLFEGEEPGPVGSSRAHQLTWFQEAGARRAARILRDRGGVIIADAVGLGKTFIALALIGEELERQSPAHREAGLGATVLVAVPAVLRTTWQTLLRRFAAHHRRCVHVLSHAQLSRGSYPRSLGTGLRMTVVDEAHRFRNTAARRYAALASLARGGRVVLLTATPVNNSPADLLSLLELFLDDDALMDAGVPSLREAFSDDGPSGSLARRVVRELVVRRGRTSLLRPHAMSGPVGLPPTETVAVPVGLRFPTRAPPRIVRYDDPRFATLVAEIEALELAPYAAPRPDADPGNGATALIRLGLLKRLESGIAALEKSVRRQQGFLASFAAALESGRLLEPGRPGSRGSAQDGDPMQMVLLDIISRPAPPEMDTGLVLASVRRDLGRLQRMTRLMSAADPKLAALGRLVAGLGPGDRCVVFTEFRDTAEAIWRFLAPVIPAGRVDGSGAWLGLRPAGRLVVIRRFAPVANASPIPPRREAVRVLVATDVLAEGLNLQDARHVVAYDLPWNPVRLMQRMGRVDRLGSPHDTVVPHLFLPESGLEPILGLVRRLRRKLGSIVDTLGDEESLQLLERLGQGPDAAADALGALERRAEDPGDRLRPLWQEHGPAPGAIRRHPFGTIVAALPRRCDRWPEAVALVESRGRQWVAEVSDDGSAGAFGHPAAELITHALELTQARGETSWLARIAPRVIAGLQNTLAAENARVLAPPMVRPGDPAARLARQLRRAMADGSALESGLLVRIDRLLQDLARPLSPHIAPAARRVARRLAQETSPEVIVRQVEALVARRRGGSGRVAWRTNDTVDYGAPRVLAVLLVAPRTPPSQPASACPGPSPEAPLNG